MAKQDEYVQVKKWFCPKASAMLESVTISSKPYSFANRRACSACQAYCRLPFLLQKAPTLFRQRCVRESPG